MELEHRPVDLHCLEPLAAQNEPGAAVDRRPARPHEPASTHLQVAAQDNAALEPQQQILADSLDALELEAVQSLRDPGDGRPRMRRLGLDALPDQRLQPLGGSAERIALGHAASVAPEGAFVHALQLPVSGGGLNIAAVARRTGVGEHTLRKWEQRYGVLRPTRTDGGQRRYSQQDVGRVEWLAARLREGYRIGEAAAMLTATGGEAPGSPEELRDALLAAAAGPGREGLEPLLDHAFALYPLDQALRDVIAPWLVLVGERWERGELSVGQEHFATAAVRARLERTLAEPRGAVRGRAVLACAPGEQHELGLLMLACLLRADGWEIVYLGQATPVVDAVAITRDQNASMLALSVTMRENIDPLERGFRVLKDVTRTRSVVIGGRAASAGLAKNVGARYVGGDLAKAVPTLRRPLQ